MRGARSWSRETRRIQITLFNHIIVSICIIESAPSVVVSNSVNRVTFSEEERGIGWRYLYRKKASAACRDLCSMQQAPHLSAEPHVTDFKVKGPPTVHCLTQVRSRYSPLSKKIPLHSLALMATVPSFTATGHLQVLRDPINSSQESIE